MQSRRILLALGICALIALVVPSVMPVTTGLSEHSGPVVLEGTLEVFLGDDFVNRRAHYSYFLVTSAGERIALEVGGRAEEARALAGANVRVRGSLANGSLTVTALEEGTAAEGPATAAELVTGEKKVVVIHVNFQNDTSEPWTLDYAREIVFTYPDSVNEYYQEESAGLVSLTGKLRSDGDVYGWYTIPYDNTTCGDDDLLNWGLAAISAATSDGVDLTGYDNIMFAWPFTSACSFGGRALVPGSILFINGEMYAPLVGHELGHNFGLHHASAYDCTDGIGQRVSISDTCTIDEYGDPFDIMGDAYAHRHKHSRHKGQLGFLPLANTLTLAQGTGTYSLAPSEQPLTGQTQALRIPRRVSPTEGVMDYYYLDFRQPYGTFFDDFSPSDPAVNGVTIRVATDYTTADRSLLIDATPGTYDFYDAPLPVGETFFDPDAGISITTLGVSPLAATVEIAVDSDSDDDGCSNAAENGPDETQGGQRDYLNFWDFYDVWTHPVGNPAGWERNAAIDLFGDIFGVMNRFGAAGDPNADPLVPPGDETGYHPAFDRGALVGPNPWDLGPADGSIDLFIDIFGVMNQFGHDCT